MYKQRESQNILFRDSSYEVMDFFEGACGVQRFSCNDMF